MTSSDDVIGDSHDDRASAAFGVPITAIYSLTPFPVAVTSSDDVIGDFACPTKAALFHVALVLFLLLAVTSSVAGSGRYYDDDDDVFPVTMTYFRCVDDDISGMLTMTYFRWWWSVVGAVQRVGDDVFPVCRR